MKREKRPYDEEPNDRAKRRLISTLQELSLSPRADNPSGKWVKGPFGSSVKEIKEYDDEQLEGFDDLDDFSEDSTGIPLCPSSPQLTEYDPMDTGSENVIFIRSLDELSDSDDDPPSRSSSPSGYSPFEIKRKYLRIPSSVLRNRLHFYQYPSRELIKYEPSDLVVWKVLVRDWQTERDLDIDISDTDEKSEDSSIVNDHPYSTAIDSRKPAFIESSDMDLD